MFKRKIVKVKDNKFLEELEKVFATSNSSGILSPEELHALRYEFGNWKLNIHNPSLIQRITINELFHNNTYDYTTERDGFVSCADSLSVTNNWVQAITQRLMFFKDSSVKNFCIKLYIPSEDDTIIQFRNSDDYVSLLHNAVKDGEIHHIVVDDKITHELNFKKEFFAFTNYNIGNSTIVIHYVP